MAIFVYITAASENEAKKIGKMLVETHLAACANIFPQMSSIYFWNNELQEDNESVLIVKTEDHCFENLCTAVKKIHSYETPCIVAMPIAKADKNFLSFIQNNTKNTIEC